MKLTFLGTSAGECYPALWCRCDNCTYARTHGGKNLRENSCLLIDDDVMIDLSATTFARALANGKDLSQIRTLLVTHDHMDHFYPQHLACRHLPRCEGKSLPLMPIEGNGENMEAVGPRFTPLPMLEIFGHESVGERLYAAIGLPAAGRPAFSGDNGIEAEYTMHFNPVQRGGIYMRDDLTLTALVSQHSRPGTAFNYILERGSKSLLYALDMGGYDEDMWAIVLGRRYDAVVLDGTFGLMRKDDAHHNNLGKCQAFLEKLNANGCWVGAPRLILSHLAPHYTPPHDVFVPMANALGMDVAYDGMTLTL